MYNRSSNSKTQDLLSNDTTQKRVSNDSTQVPVVEKSNPTDFIPNTVSVDTTQNPAHVSSSLLASQLPSFATPAPTKKAYTPVTNQDLESSLATKKDSTIEDLNVSSSSSQVINKKSLSIDQELTTLSSTQSIRNDMTALNTDLIYGTNDKNITGVISTGNVNEEAVPIPTTKKGKQKARSAPVIKTRELQKRRSATNVNYREQIEYDTALVEEESAGEKPAEKPAGKKVGKRKLAEKELAEKEYGEENPVQVQESRSKRQKKLSAKSELNKKGNLGAAKVEGSKKRKHQDKDEEIEDIPKKKVTRRTKAVVEKEKEEKRKQEEKEKEDEEKKEEEDEEVKMNRLLQSKNSFLTEANLRELIPQWIKALPEEDKLELAPLLPELDCEVKEGQLTIKQDFGANSNHLYDAAEQWQNLLALGGFEKDDDELEGQVLTDPFKDENYERNWGERLCEKYIESHELRVL